MARSSTVSQIAIRKFLKQRPESAPVGRPEVEAARGVRFVEHRIKHMSVKECVNLLMTASSLDQVSSYQRWSSVKRRTF